VAAVRAAARPLGSVPYDNFTLPLISPDGRHVATETGLPPRWETVVADPGAPAAQATEVEIYGLTYEGQELLPPRLELKLAEPVLLGRMGDAEGFLVESQRDAGARWIGKAAWTGGEVRWLVADEAVNAFAALGPRGQLAWSRRPPGGDRFELVVRGTDGQAWSIDTGDDWLMPAWSGRDDGLFVLQLREGMLDLVHVVATSPITFRQSAQFVHLTDQATVGDAYQTLIVQPPMMGVASVGSEHLVFHHPGEKRAAVWQPRAMGSPGIQLLVDRSYTAMLDSPGSVLVATPRDLWRQSLANRRDRVQLLKGLLIPRPVAYGQWSHVLLEPQEGMVSLTAMTLLPLERPRE
jgi:hypothetical protein